MIRRFKLSIFVIVIMIISLSLIIPTSSSFKNEIIKIDSKSSSRTTHEWIAITQDTHFADYSFPGSGTEVDPYIIENYDISGGIEISGTTEYFIIRNCYMDNDDDKTPEAKIVISDAANGTVVLQNNVCPIEIYASDGIVIESNVCSNSDVSGIYLENCKNAVVWNNICNNNDNYGIAINYCPGVEVEFNTCNNNLWEGIFLNATPELTGYPNNVLLRQNKCYSNGAIGIFLFYHKSSKIVLNHLQDNGGWGVFLYFSEDIVVKKNNFYDNNPKALYALSIRSQACDYSYTNMWENTWDRNYWSDYDGEGDYYIDGYPKAYASGLKVIDKNPVRKNYTRALGTPEGEFVSYNFLVFVPSIILLVILRYSLRKRKHS